MCFLLTKKFDPQAQKTNIDTNQVNNTYLEKFEMIIV